MIDERLLQKLNAPTPEARLSALEAALQTAEFPPMDERLINNHIHTTFSFSPYSPTAAAYAARAEGLCTCGIVDHDSVGGALEFVAAGKLIGIPTTVGAECRVSMAGTALEGLRTNNPDQIGVSYMVLHGIPHRFLSRVQAFFAPLRAHRNERNRAMLERVNKEMGTSLSFERDVLPLSQYRNGGSVTERHLMQALARAIAPGSTLLEEYDLIGKLKKDCIPKVYLPATDECPTLDALVSLAEEICAILCYAYLGDVTSSVTGDKKAQRFEDGHLELLFETLERHKVRAVTYMPTRNTDAQLARLSALCKERGFLEVSGEDINSPRQSFIIEKMFEPRFQNLIESTWKIIRNETEGEA